MSIFGFLRWIDTKSGSAYLVRTRWGVNEELSTGSTSVAGALGWINMSVPVSNEIIEQLELQLLCILCLAGLPTYYPPHSETFVGVSVKIKYQSLSFMFLPVVRK